MLAAKILLFAMREATPREWAQAFDQVKGLVTHCATHTPIATLDFSPRPNMARGMDFLGANLDSKKEGPEAILGLLKRPRETLGYMKYCLVFRCRSSRRVSSRLVSIAPSRLIWSRLGLSR